MKKISPFTILFLLLITSSCTFGQVKEITENKQQTAVSIENIINKQVLLTNNAEFTKKRTLEGASGFLIRYKGSNFAVTARHLLGEAGGVEPEIKSKDINKELLKWEMSPRVSNNAARETVRLNATGINTSNTTNDILLLNVISEINELGTLTPNFSLPSNGETLFLIGCPYSEPRCKQNFYKLNYVEFDDAESVLVLEIQSDVKLSGFSGAPVVNKQGEVHGVLVSGGEVNGKNYVMATHIKEIQKMK